MPREKKPDPIHTDRLGREIVVGSKVAAPRSNSLKICTVTKLNPKMITVHVVNTGEAGYANHFHVYSKDTVVLDGEDVLSYILKGHKG